MGDFSGKTVLITGASNGLGRVAAGAFVKAGANVIATARSEEKLEGLRKDLSPGAECVCVAEDLLTSGAIQRLLDRVWERFRDVDIVLHALGGGYGFRDPLLTQDQLSTLHQLNLGVGAELNRLLVPSMSERGWGRIVHVGSIASGEVVASVGYNAVKAGVAAYVRGLGRALAGTGVVVTGILPGAFEGPDNAFARLKANNPEAYQDFRVNRLPRGRVGRAEELIRLIFLLAGDGASMMAGSCVPIDAGEGHAVSPDAFL